MYVIDSRRDSWFSSNTHLSSIQETLYKSPKQVVNCGGGLGNIPGQ